MIGIASAIAFLRNSRGAQVALAAAALAAILTLAYCHGRSTGRDSEVVKQQEREIEVQRDLGDANENAAEFRVEDARKLDAQERELQDATRDAKNADDARRRRACVVLRQQNPNRKDLPPGC
jgi:hypothetical protein